MIIIVNDIGPMADFWQPPSAGVEVVAAVDIDYEMPPWLVAAPDIRWLEYIQAATVISLPESVEVVAATRIAWREAWQIARPVTVTWNTLATVAAAVEVEWSAVAEVIAVSALTWDLLAATPVLAAHGILWSAAPAPSVEPLTVAVRYDDQSAWAGVDLAGSGDSHAAAPGGQIGWSAPAALQSIVHLHIAVDRREYAIRAEIALADPAEYQACVVGTAVELELFGEVIMLRVTARNRARQDAEGSYILSLASPAAWLDAPWALPVATEAGGTAAGITTDMAAPLAVDWQLMDWGIGPGLLPADTGTPMELIRKLAGAPGGLVRSGLDGTLVIEPWYPVGPLAWPTTMPAHVIDEAAVVHGADEEEDPRPLVNAVMVSNETGESDSGSIRIEIVDVDAHSSLIRVYAVPWDAAVSLRHTDGPPATLTLVGVEERAETALVEFVDGAGSTPYPVRAVVATAWKTEPLGAVTAAQSGELTAEMSAESLLEIDYTTICMVWQLTSATGEAIQVVAETDDQTSGATVSTLVSRPPADQPGADVFDQLITELPVALARGASIIDAGCSRRSTVRLSITPDQWLHVGAIVEVRDLEIPAWRGLLHSQDVYLDLSGDSLVLESFVEIEKEVA